MEKSSVRRVRRPCKTVPPNVETRASMLAVKSRCVPTRYPIAVRPGRLKTSTGVACVSPSQHPHGLNVASVDSLIIPLPTPADTHLGPESLDHCHTVRSPSDPMGETLASARLRLDCPGAGTA